MLLPINPKKNLPAQQYGTFRLKISLAIEQGCWLATFRLKTMVKYGFVGIEK